MEIKSLKDLDASSRNLIEKSLEARKKAYSRYSNFQVGAALLLDNGSIFLGSNVENASFGLTICAERCAFVKAISDGVPLSSFDTVVVSAISLSKGELVTPCGACRQFMAEFNPKLKIILYNPDLPPSSSVGLTTLDYLLPESYRLHKGATSYSNGSTTKNESQ